MGNWKFEIKIRELEIGQGENLNYEPRSGATGGVLAQAPMAAPAGTTQPGTQPGLGQSVLAGTTQPAAGTTQPAEQPAGYPAGM